MQRIDNTLQSSATLPRTHRILIYTTCYNVLDGVTLTVRKIEQVLLEAGHHVCIVTTTSGNSNNTNLDGEHPNRHIIFIDDAVPLAQSYDPHSPENTYKLGFSLSSAVKRQIEDFEPTLIHVTVPDCTCLHLIEYARRKELPLMGTYHSNIPEYLKHYPGLGWLKYILEGFFRHQYNFLQALYVPTPFIHKQLTTTLRMDQITKLGVWGRGIDLERFSPKHRSQKFRAHFGFQDDDVVLLWVGRLVPEKRPDIFIEVVRRLQSKNVPFKALIVGAGPSEESMKGLPNTTFTGWMNGEQLATAYASSDVFLFPSAVETFGNVSLEAAASGLPIVVEEGCGGHLVRHGVSGFACGQHDADAFFNSVLCLVLDDKRRREMSQEGRRLSMNFEKRTVCERMIENYSKVTDEFYHEYGGFHANRDAVYMKKEHSFTSGNTTRPLVIVCVEYLFIILFQVVYRLTVIFMFLREQMIFVAPAPTGIVSSHQQRQDSDVVLVSLGSDSSENSKGYSLSRLGEEMEKGMQLQEKRDKVLSAIKEEDEDTDSTSSMSTATPTSQQQKEPLHPTHKAAIIFMEATFFITRMESRVRNAVSGYTRRNGPRLLSRRKRKDSSDEGFDSMSSLVQEDSSLNMRRASCSHLIG